MRLDRRNLVFLFIILSYSCSAPDESYSSLKPFSFCTVDIPVFFQESFISTQIEFLNPQSGSRHILGSLIPLNIAVTVLPEFPLGLALTTELCLQLDQRHAECFNITNLNNLPMLQFEGADEIGEHIIVSWLQLSDSNIRLDCHIPGESIRILIARIIYSILNLMKPYK